MIAVGLERASFDCFHMKKAYLLLSANEALGFIEAVQRLYLKTIMSTGSVSSADPYPHTQADSAIWSSGNARLEINLEDKPSWIESSASAEWRQDIHELNADSVFVEIDSGWRHSSWLSQSIFSKDEMEADTAISDMLINKRAAQEKISPAFSAISRLLFDMHAQERERRSLTILCDDTQSGRPQKTDGDILSVQIKADPNSLLSAHSGDAIATALCIIERGFLSVEQDLGIALEAARSDIFALSTPPSLLHLHEYYRARSQRHIKRNGNALCAGISKRDSALREVSDLSLRMSADELIYLAGSVDGIVGQISDLIMNELTHEQAGTNLSAVHAFHIELDDFSIDLLVET
ncbi:MAG: hypothetical protein HFJ65_06175 [Eggerthellaceae bacterium]|nr:hypothetical protein [Eggerthellaceae bacterium]